MHEQDDYHLKAFHDSCSSEEDNKVLTIDNDNQEDKNSMSNQHLFNSQVSDDIKHKNNYHYNCVKNNNIYYNTIKNNNHNYNSIKNNINHKIKKY